MIDPYLLLAGFVTGVVVAAPIGPVNLICIRRTLRHGPVDGTVVGWGAAFGDGVFALIAAFGLTAAIELVKQYAMALQIGGGLVLIVMGAVTYRAKTAVAPPDAPTMQKSSFGLMGTTFLLTVTNPATLLGFIAIFSGVGGLAGHSDDFGVAAMIVGMVILGSAFWWAGLCLGVSVFRAGISDRTLSIINRVSGVLIGLFGVAVLARVLYETVK